MFITRLRADSGDRSPWGDFWFQPVGGLRTGAGMRVNADSAMRLAAVYACVRVLTESFAVLPVRFYKPRYGGRGRTVVKDHPLLTLLTKRPNAFQTPFEFREMIMGHVVLRGNSFCQIVEDGAGGIVGLIPMHPDRIKIEMLPTGDYRYIFTKPDGSQVTYRRDQVWHLRGLSSDGIVGMNPIELQREAIGAGLAAQDYGNRFWLNDAKPTGGWIEMAPTAKFQDDTARVKFKENLQAATGGSNRHKTLVLEGGMKYHEIGLTNKDSQFLESRNYTRTEIAGMFRVAPHLIGDLSRATYSNIEQQSIDHWQNTMLPWTERWESSLETLVGDLKLEIEFDYRNLMRGDASSRAAYIHAGVLDGWLTRNEGRELEGLDPIDGLDEPLVPINEQTLTESQEPPEPVTPPGVGEPAKEQPADGDEGEDGENGKDASAQRLHRVLIGNADRMARRWTGGNPPTADVLADALAIDPAVAAAALGAPNLQGLQSPVLATELLGIALKGTLS